MTAKGTPQIQSWLRRGHSVDCWRHHPRCALASARDLLDNRAAYLKDQAAVFRAAVDGMDRSTPVPPDWHDVARARKILTKVHAEMRATRDR